MKEKMKYKGHAGGKGKFPMLEDQDSVTNMEENISATEGKTPFGPEHHGIPEEDWPKKFVTDGFIEDIGGFGREARGVDNSIAVEEAESRHDGEDIPGKTHEHDDTKGRIKTWPKKFKTDGMTDGFDSGE